MTKAIAIILAYAVGAAAYTLGFEYLGDQHQGLLVFTSMTIAVSAGRMTPRPVVKQGV